MTPQLVITAGPDKGRVFPLVAGETLQIGRSQATATKLTDPTVSRVHCEVEWDGERAVLINISTGGTFVNGHTVSQHQLKPGDVIKCGGTELRFQVDDGGEATTVVPPPAKASAHAPEPLSALVGQTLSHYTLE